MGAIHIIDEVTLTSKEGMPILVDIRYCPKEGQKELPVIIFSHGFKGFKDWGPFNQAANKLAKAGFCVVKFNFSYNGTTPEHSQELYDLDIFAKNTLSREMDDLESVVDFVKKGNVQKAFAHVPSFTRVFLAGHSRGGMISLLVAKEGLGFDGIVTWGCVADMESKWTKEELSLWKAAGTIKVFCTRTSQHLPLSYEIVEDFYQNKQRVDLKDHPGKIQEPVCIIHTKDDETVSVAEAHEIQEMFPHAELHLIEDGGHLFGAAHPWGVSTLPGPMNIAVEKTIDYLNRLLKNDGYQDKDHLYDRSGS